MISAPLTPASNLVCGPRMNGCACNGTGWANTHICMLFLVGSDYIGILSFIGMAVFDMCIERHDVSGRPRDHTAIDAASAKKKGRGTRKNWGKLLKKGGRQIGVGWTRPRHEDR